MCDVPDCRRDPTLLNVAKDCTLADWLFWYCNFDISVHVIPVAHTHIHSQTTPKKKKHQKITFNSVRLMRCHLTINAKPFRLPKYPWTHRAANQSMDFRSNPKLSICPTYKTLWAPIRLSNCRLNSFVANPNGCRQQRAENKNNCNLLNKWRTHFNGQMKKFVNYGT